VRTDIKACVSCGTLAASITTMYFYGLPAYPFVAISIYFVVDFIRSVRRETPGHPIVQPPPILFSNALLSVIEVDTPQSISLNQNRFSNPRIP
jgi:hypothetical protein